VAREHRARQDVRPPQQRDSEPEPDRGLTPAEQHAMRRSAPLKPPQFEELRRLAERGANPLRRV
jgi:hypothetical protein